MGSSMAATAYRPATGVFSLGLSRATQPMFKGERRCSPVSINVVKLSDQARANTWGSQFPF